MIRLTDKKMDAIMDKVWRGVRAKDGYVPGEECADAPIADAIAKAQLKEMVEWGDDTCDDTTHDGYVNSILRRECPDCWQVLLEEGK